MSVSLDETELNEAQGLYDSFLEGRISKEGFQGAINEAYGEGNAPLGDWLSARMRSATSECEPVLTGVPETESDVIERVCSYFATCQNENPRNKKALYNLTWDSLSTMMEKLEINKCGSQLLVEICRRVITGESFNPILRHQSVVYNKDSPIYCLSLWHLLLYFLTTDAQGLSLIKQYVLRNPGNPIPLVYPNWKQLGEVTINANINRLLSKHRAPILISIGKGRKDKTDYLQMLFPVTSNQVLPLNNGMREDDFSLKGAELVLSTDKYTIPLHILDVKLDLLENVDVIANLVQCFPAESTIILAHHFGDKSETAALLKVCKDRSLVSNIVVFRNRNDIMQLSAIRLQSICDPQNFHSCSFITDIQSPSQISKVRSVIFESVEMLSDCAMNFDFLEKFPDSLPRISGSSSDDKNIENALTKLFIVDKGDQKTFFKALYLRRQIQEIQQKKDKIWKTPRSEIPNRLELMEYMEEQSESLQKSMKEKPYPETHLVMEFDRYVKNCDWDKLESFSDIIQAWQKPISDKLLERRKQISLSLEGLEASQESSAEDIKQYEDELSVVNSQLQLNFSSELFWREIVLMYSNDLNRHVFFKQTMDSFYDGYFKYINQSKSFEIIDGFDNEMNEDSLRQILTRYEAEHGYQRPFVISVIGPQSSGKSTLLNFMFGCDFQTRAGRCTKGMYGTLLQTDYPGAGLTMVLDTEGLLSVERENDSKTFDTRMATLSMGLSQVIIVNVKGEMNADMKSVLTISLMAAKQLRMCEGRRPILFIVLRDMMDVDQERQSAFLDRLLGEFEEIAHTLEVPLKELVEFDRRKSFILMHGAFNTLSFTDEHEKTLYKSFPVSNAFSHSCSELLQKVMKYAEKDEVLRTKSLTNFVDDCSSYWTTLRDFNDLLSLQSIKDIRDQNKLQEISTKIRQNILENPIYDDSVEPALMAILSINSCLPDSKLLSLENEFLEKVSELLNKEVAHCGYNCNIVNQYRRDLQSQVRVMIEAAQFDYKKENAFTLSKRELENIQEKMIENISKDIERYKKQLLADKNAAGRSKVIEALEFKNEEALNSYRREFIQELERVRKTHEQLCLDARQLVENVSSQFNFVKQAYLFSVTNIDKCYKDVIDNPKMEFVCPFNWTAIGSKMTLDAGETMAQLSKLIAVTDEQSFRNKAKVNTKSYYYQELVARHQANLANVSDIDNYLYSKFEGSILQPITTGVREQDKEISRQRIKMLAEYEKQRMIAKYGWQAFEEMGEKVCDLLNYQTNLVVSRHKLTAVIEALYREKKDIEAMVLKPKNLHWSDRDLGELLARRLLFYTLTGLNAEEEEKVEKFKVDFSNNKEALRATFSFKVKSTLGDDFLADSWAWAIMSAWKADCRKEFLRDFLKEVVNRSNDSKHWWNFISDKEDKIIKPGNGGLNERHFLLWAFNYSKYLDAAFKEFLSSNIERIRKLKKAAYLQNVNLMSLEIDNALTTLKQLFEIVIKNTKAFNADQITHIANQVTLLTLQGNTDLIQQSLHEVLVSGSNAVSGSVELFELVGQVNFQALRSMTKSVMFENIEQDKFKDFPKFIDTFQRQMGVEFNKCYQEDEHFIDSIKDEVKSEMDRLKDLLMERMIGCRATCPYCGAKCEEKGSHDANIKHKTNRHRPMGIKGSFSVNPVGKKVLLPYACNEPYNLNETKWRAVHDFCAVDNQRGVDNRVKEMLLSTDAPLTSGQLKFTLFWHNANDLDLKVMCPCGNTIKGTFPYTKKRCGRCSGMFSGEDVNQQYRLSRKHFDASNPAEEIVFPMNPKEGRYHVIVKGASLNVKRGAIEPSRESEYDVKVTSGGGDVLKVFQGKMTPDRKLRVEWFNYAVGTSFEKHMEKFYKDWEIKETETRKFDRLFVERCANVMFQLEQDIVNMARIESPESSVEKTTCIRAIYEEY